MQEGVSAQAEPDGFKRDNLFGGDVAQVDIGAQQFNEPNLLSFLGRLPDNFFKWNFGKNFLNEARPHFARSAEQAYVATFAGFPDYFPGACFQFSASSFAASA